MTATEQPTLRIEAPPAGAALGRAEGIELLGPVEGSGYRDGIALIRRADGQMVQLGPLMYALLEAVDGRRSNTELAAHVSEQIGRDCDESHVQALAEKLAAQGLLAGSEQNAPPRRNPLLALRWKVLVTDPKVTSRITAPFTFLYRPWIVAPVVVAFVAVVWFTLFRKGLAVATADAFHRPGLLLLIFALAVASAGFHEIGHASAARYGGATPGGMGMGLYLVWPAFYTDVTDAYRLPRGDRLRVDLGGLYFNAIVSVVTVGAWLAWHVDALFLLIALQLLMMVKNLSPIIRSDGYHILSDATGVPDLYAHIMPTLRRLLPWRRPEPSALTGRARLLVTLWVLIVAPILLSLMIGAIVLLPRLTATAWASGRQIASNMPNQGPIGIVASVLQLFALILPVAGSVLIAQKLGRSLAGKGLAWSEGSPVRRTALIALTAAAFCGAAWAWWPSGQYQPVRATDRGTLLSLGHAIASPGTAVRPSGGGAAGAPVHVAPGRHLAVAMIPVGGATKEHPALFVIAGGGDDPPVAILSTTSPDPTAVSSSGTPTNTTTSTTATTTDDASGQTVRANVFPFSLPKAPGPGDSQALAVNRTDGGVVYDIAYSLITVRDGGQVMDRNGAYAFANCMSCTTVAVSFQIVLIVGQSNVIAPIDIALAENGACVACLTTAIATQIVVTLKAQPTDALVAKLQSALQQLNALRSLGAEGTPAAIATQVEAVRQQVEQALDDSGLLTEPATTTTSKTTTTTPTTTAATTTTAAATTTAAQTTTTTPTTTSAAQETTTQATTTTAAPTTTAATTTTATTTTGTTTTTATTTATTATTTSPEPTTTTSG